MEPTCCGVSSQVSVIKRTRTLGAAGVGCDPGYRSQPPCSAQRAGTEPSEPRPCCCRPWQPDGEHPEIRAPVRAAETSEDATIWPAPRLPRSSDRSRWLVCWNIQRSKKINKTNTSSGVMGQDSSRVCVCADLLDRSKCTGSRVRPAHSGRPARCFHPHAVSL